MRKVFLCHSSNDKSYVRIVATKLGRARIVFDEISFTPGTDFRAEILRHLNETDVFVFFASEASLSSLWCKYEIDEAFFSAATSSIKSFLTIIIDANTKYSDLPRWLQRTKAVIQTRPTQATRDVQHILYSLYSPVQQKPFVGRGNSLEEITSIISQLTEEPKRILAISGLEGIGRRSYLARACRDLLGLSL